MESESNTNKKSILVRIADQLMKNQQELDAMVVQLYLGKTEVKDKFEESKKNLRNSVHEFRVKLLEDYHQQSKEWTESFKTKLNDLDTQLNETKTETKAMFEEQRKNILKSLEDIKKDIQNNPEVLKMSDFFNTASENAKLQMEIFEKKWGAAQSDLKEEFKDEMKNAKERIDTMMENAKEKRDEIQEKFKGFNEEMATAYEHMKKAIKSL